MPLSRTDNQTTAAAWPESPRAAALQALVYRRRLREPPRYRTLRIVAFFAALLIHLVFVFGVILGPAYDLPESSTGTEALVVRLIDKPEPPPPPVRGRAPKQQALVRPGATRTAKFDRSSRGVAALSAPPLTPTPTPTVQPPVIAMTPPHQTVQIRPLAAPVPPQSLPKSAPTPQLAPIPVPGAPPQTLTIQAPPTVAPVPPKFQPEPVRMARAEGNQAMPDPASLVLPEVPAPALPQAEVPQIALPPSVTAPVAVTAPVVTSAVAAAPPVPELQAIPLPAQPTPAVNVDSTLTTATPIVPTVQVQVPHDTATVAEEAPQLAPVPLAEPANRPTVSPPQAPVAKLEEVPPQLASLPLPTTVAPSPGTVSEVQAHAGSEPRPGTAADEAPAADAAASAIASTANASGQASSASNAGRREGAQVPSGSTDAALPGEALDGSGQQPSSHVGRGTVPNAQGRAGTSEGEVGKAAPPGSYVQVQPHGDTRIMSHDLPPIGYTPTRFDKDWTPLHESSADTAVRRVAEKMTFKHTFTLPHGVRVDCVISPLGWMIVLGCSPQGPQQTALASSVYARLSLAPVQPLVPPAPATRVAAPVAMALDNSAACASARVAGGPPPPDCQSVNAPVAAPLSSNGSWVPASDQFH
ncbi:MAG: hypothetical protein ABW154_08205 [Dyella sp.]